MMKRFVLVFASLGFTLPCHAGEAVLVKCKATQIFDYSVFEEAFSTFEYPWVSLSVDDVARYSMSVGAAQFVERDDNLISVRVTKGGKRILATVQPKGWSSTVNVIRNPNGVGVVEYREAGGKKRKIASLICE